MGEVLGAFLWVQGGSDYEPKCTQAIFLICMSFAEEKCDCVAKSVCLGRNQHDCRNRIFLLPLSGDFFARGEYSR